MSSVDFGFYYCQVIHYYSLSENAVMGMPIRRFWLFVANIDRINAQKDLRALNVGACVQSPEGVKEYRNTLTVELGEIQGVEGRARGTVGTERQIMSMVATT